MAGHGFTGHGADVAKSALVDIGGAARPGPIYPDPIIMSDYVQLRFKDASGKPQLEPVSVESLDGGAYLILTSPHFVYGLAAGDEIELEETGGYFQVLSRGGNLSVRVFAEAPLAEAFDVLVGEVEAVLAGRVDGRLAKAAVFTIAAAAGFDEIEAVFNDFIDQVGGTVWEYGNVYDGEGEPLEWWL